MAVQQAQAQGQQSPPPPQLPPDPITWEAVVEAMHSDATRTYRVDIETDSTLSATQDSDMQGLKDLLGGITSFIEGIGPAVQQGAIPIEAVKEIVGVVVRRAKMGSAVEDALSKMQQPKPQPDPNAAKAQADAQAAQMKMQADQQAQQAQMQHEAQLEQFKAGIADQQHQRQLAADLQAKQHEAQFTMQLEQHKQEMQAAQIQHQNELEAQREMQRQALEAQAEERKAQMEQEDKDRQRAFEQWKAELDASTKIDVAEIAAKSALDTSLASAQQSANNEVTESLGGDDQPEDSGPTLQDLHGTMQELIQHITAPKTIERDEQGRAVSVGGRKVVRGPDNKIIGVQ